MFIVVGVGVDVVFVVIVIDYMLRYLIVLAKEQQAHFKSVNKYTGQPYAPTA